MPFRLNDDRVAVLADAVSEVTETGLFVPDSGQNPLRYGVVAVVGSGRRADTGRVPIDFLVGERVFFHKHSGQPMEIEGLEYVVLAPAEIIGVVQDIKGPFGAESLPWPNGDDGDATVAEIPEGDESDVRVLVSA
jgi:chaperonin GroES